MREGTGIESPPSHQIFDFTLHHIFEFSPKIFDFHAVFDRSFADFHKFSVTSKQLTR